MKQQPYFIRPPSNICSPNLANKGSFNKKEETSSNSQGGRRKTPINTQHLNSPVQVKDLYRNKIIKTTPNLNTPLTEGSISKFKIINDFTLNKMATSKRLKSDEQVCTPKQNNKFHSHPLNNIKFRTDRKLNNTPLDKMKTEPNDFDIQTVSKQDESQEILFRLHRQSIPTEPNEKLSSILSNHITITRNIKKEVQSSDQSNRIFIKIEQNIPHLQETQENKLNPHQFNSSSTKEKILDLLCLSTQDLKTKLSEINKVGNSKINARQSNKLLIPKRGISKFPNDFFNALLPNSILH
ncbi:unnamed protein product [Paramecium sonneborni]|uniref:Uncharacterized protein n=1 Tax=Paramecium sonneborni TaxID=65129 RepID=A0A8S1RC95_9CILI|nr:unnamed protein product [Paramecium sonneborni]